MVDASRKPPSKSRKVRDRVFEDGVTISCFCGKRLAIMQLTAWQRVGKSKRSTVPDGIFFAKHERAMSDGLLDLAEEDWFKLTCPKCRHEYSSRNDNLAALIEQAQSRGEDRVKLPLGGIPRANPPKEPKPIERDLPDTPLPQSRQW